MNIDLQTSHSKQFNQNVPVDVDQVHVPTRNMVFICWDKYCSWSSEGSSLSLITVQSLSGQDLGASDTGDYLGHWAQVGAGSKVLRAPATKL